MKFLITIEKDEEGYYVVECPAIPGCVSQGKTETEALENVKDAIVSCLEARKSLKLPLTIEIREIEVDTIIEPKAA